MIDQLQTEASAKQFEIYLLAEMRQASRASPHPAWASTSGPAMPPKIKGVSF